LGEQDLIAMALPMAVTLPLPLLADRGAGATKWLTLLLELFRTDPLSQIIRTHGHSSGRDLHTLSLLTC
jgi:hypothetical protein